MSASNQSSIQEISSANSEITLDLPGLDTVPPSLYIDHMLIVQPSQLQPMASSVHDTSSNLLNCNQCQTSSIATNVKPIQLQLMPSNQSSVHDTSSPNSLQLTPSKSMIHNGRLAVIHRFCQEKRDLIHNNANLQFENQKLRQNLNQLRSVYFDCSTIKSGHNVNTT
eukprot:377685_1